MNKDHHEDNTSNQREVAHLRQQIDLKHEAAQRGMSELAAVMQPETTIVRMDPDAGQLL